jgi:hypothetical protein
MAAMKSPSRSAVGNTNVPVIVAQALGKLVMGKCHVLNAPKEKDSALINVSVNSLAYHL